MLVDRNPHVLMSRTELTNDPSLISLKPADGQHQLLARGGPVRAGERLTGRGRIYSGLGGQADFVVGAIHSPGGQALIGLRSWHPRADTSTIVPLVGGAVTSFQMTAVITEQGRPTSSVTTRSDRQRT